MVDYPEAEALDAVQKLIDIHELLLYGHPVGSALAEEALEAAADRLHRSGLLDDLIGRAARRMRLP